RRRRCVVSTSPARSIPAWARSTFTDSAGRTPRLLARRDRAVPPLVAQMPEDGPEVGVAAVGQFVEHATQDAVGDLEAERPVALELRLGEDLIARPLMGELRIGDRIGADVGVLDAVIARLDVEDRAEIAVAAAVGGRIVDLADGVVRDVGAEDRVFRIARLE